MTPANPKLSALSDDNRQLLEPLLVKFDQVWSKDRLAEVVDELPDPGSPLRLPALLELIKIDLERQWQLGRQPTVETYLNTYPELGGPDQVSADLLLTEFEVRRQFGAAVTLSDFAQRFPRQANALTHLVEQAHETLSNSAGTQTDLGTIKPGLSTPALARSAVTASVVPEQFGRYRVLKQLGKGGMGSVYLARDCTLDREVALKIPDFSADDPEILQRFYREARAAAALHHPNLCPVHDVGAIDGIHFLTMAYISGPALATYARDHHPLPQDQVVRLVRTIALALAKAHQHGIIHRDLKPSNIMLDGTGEPIVMDFGLARRVNQNDARITKSGAILGTPAYMSPEQVVGDLDQIGPASDIYSLGVILYELLTGRIPFQGSMTSILVQISTEQPRPPSTYRAGLDPRLEAICLKALAKKPADRFASMDEFAVALASVRISTGQSSNSPRTTKTGDTSSAGRSMSTPRRVVWAAAGGAALLLLLGAIIVISTKQGPITVTVPDDNPKITVNGTVVSGAEPDKAPAPDKSKPPATLNVPPKVPLATTVPAVQPTTIAAKASADVKLPTALALGEVVKGRVDAKSKTNKSHYWLIDVPAGSYKAVVDMERADRENSNIQGQVQLLGQNGEARHVLGNFNEIDYRARRVFPVKLQKPFQGMIRVTADLMTDYHLALYPAGGAIPTPFFRQTPKITPLKLGDTFTPPVLHGNKADTCDAFCSMTLPAGDYSVTVGMSRIDGVNSNIQGKVQTMTQDGMLIDELIGVNEIDTSTKKSVKMALAEEQGVIFRIVSEGDLQATFKVAEVQDK